MFTRRPKRRVVVGALKDIDVTQGIERAAAAVPEVVVRSITHARALPLRQRVVVDVDGPDDAVRRFNKVLRRWAFDTTGGVDTLPPVGGL